MLSYCNASEEGLPFVRCLMSRWPNLHLQPHVLTFTTDPECSQNWEINYTHGMYMSLCPYSRTIITAWFGSYMRVLHQIVMRIVALIRHEQTLWSLSYLLGDLQPFRTRLEAPPFRIWFDLWDVLVYSGSENVRWCLMSDDICPYGIQRINRYACEQRAQ